MIIINIHILLNMIIIMLIITAVIMNSITLIIATILS